jgi:hypothetical protein
MDPDQIATHAEGIAAALRIIGPTPPDRVLGMLRALGLSEDAASGVLDYAVAHGLLVIDPDAGQVRLP